MYDILQLDAMLVAELRDVAEKIGLVNYKRLGKQELIYKILDQQAVTTRLSEEKLAAIEEESNKSKPHKKEAALQPPPKRKYQKARPEMKKRLPQQSRLNL